MAAVQLENRHGRKRKILVVEDSKLNREMLAMLLEPSFDVIEACDGIEGMEFLSSHYQDLSLILLDVYMPRCDGFEFLRRKASDGRFDTVPVIVATGGGSMEDEIACLELGANDFVLKPYNPEILINRVSNLIRLRESALLVNKLTWDTVTGLYTKEFFARAVDEAFDRTPDGDFDLVVSVVENYPSLTDRYGAHTCDILLHDLATALCDNMDGLRAAGYLGGSTMAFLRAHGTRDEGAELAKVTASLSIPNVNVKLGIVEHADHGMEAPKLCNRALSAINAIRGLYGVSAAYFDDEVHKHQLLEETIRESMETALGELQFTVVYQPKHNVHTDSIGGAEALVRWQHPKIGFVSPGLFIPVFEQNGFITQLDFFVWEEACKEVARLTELGLPVVPISVNASRIDFDMPDLPSRVASIADRYGVDHALLHVELTETAYADNPQSVIDTLRALKDRGFSTELDDFGSGYSSLVSLNTLPLDVMKLDMSMVRKATELDDFRIIESTINLAQVLGLSTVVEGVETEEEARRVTEMGCDYIQGYYYSRPLNRSDFEDYLRNA